MGYLRLKSEINKGILRAISSSKQNTFYLNSSVNKGDLNLRSPIGNIILPATPTIFDDRYDEYIGPAFESWWEVIDQDSFLTIDNGLIYTPSNERILNWVYMEYDDPIYFDVYIKVTIENPSGLLWVYFDISNDNWQTGSCYMDLTWGQEPGKFILTRIAQIAPGNDDSATIDSPGNSNVAYLRMAQVDGRVRHYYAVPGDTEWTEWPYAGGDCVISGSGSLSLMMTSNNAVSCTSTIHYFRDNVTNPLFS